MTFEQCQAILTEIRLRQGTDHPLVQVTCSGAVLRGRLSRADTDRVFAVRLNAFVQPRAR